MSAMRGDYGAYRDGAVETLELIPARAVIHRDVYVKYACQNCKVNDIEVPIVETPKKPSLIPGGFASPKPWRIS